MDGKLASCFKVKQTPQKEDRQVSEKEKQSLKKKLFVADKNSDYDAKVGGNTHNSNLSELIHGANNEVGEGINEIFFLTTEKVNR